MYTVSGGMFSIRLSAEIENRIEDKIRDINFPCLRSYNAFLIGNYYNVTILLLWRGLRTK